jgi:hypothetical protein
MPKIKSSKAKRGQHVASSLPSGTSHNQKPTARINEEDVEPLSPAHIRELDRRIRDSDDPIRYMLVSEFSRRFILYYNVSDDVYVMNNPAGGTLFKRLESAQSIKKQLGKRTAIVKYTTEGGKLKRLSPYRRTWGSKTRKDT